MSVRAGGVFELVCVRLLVWLACMQVRSCSVSSLRSNGSEGPEAEVPAGERTGIQKAGLSPRIAEHDVA